jgi:hypothetical protein
VGPLAVLEAFPLSEPLLVPQEQCDNYR